MSMQGGRGVQKAFVFMVAMLLCATNGYAFDYRLGMGATVNHVIDTNNRNRNGQTVDVVGDVTWLFSEVGFFRLGAAAGAGYNDFIKQDGDAATLEHWTGTASVGMALPVDDVSSLHIYGALHGAQTTQAGFEATKYGPLFGFGYEGRKYWWDIDFGPQIKSQLLLEESDPDYDRETSSGMYNAAVVGYRLGKRWAIALTHRVYDYRDLPFINNAVTGYRESLTQLSFYWVGQIVKAEPEPDFVP